MVLVSLHIYNRTTHCLYVLYMGEAHTDMNKRKTFRTEAHVLTNCMATQPCQAKQQLVCGNRNQRCQPINAAVCEQCSTSGIR